MDAGNGAGPAVSAATDSEARREEHRALPSRSPSDFQRTASPGRKTNRRISRAPSPLVEPVTIAEWKRGRGGDIVRVVLKNYESHDIVDVRIWWSDHGYRKPGKGFAIGVRHLPQIKKAIDKALAKARELGLIDAEGAA